MAPPSRVGKPQSTAPLATLCVHTGAFRQGEPLCHPGAGISVPLTNNDITHYAHLRRLSLNFAADNALREMQSSIFVSVHLLVELPADLNTVPDMKRATIANHMTACIDLLGHANGQLLIDPCVLRTVFALNHGNQADRLFEGACLQRARDQSESIRALRSTRMTLSQPTRSPQPHPLPGRSPKPREAGDPRDNSVGVPGLNLGLRSALGDSKPTLSGGRPAARNAV